MNRLISGLLLASAVASKTLNIMTISDIHLDPSNTVTIPNYGDKLSVGLLKTMLADAKSQYGKDGPDVIMLVGDNCMHGLGISDWNPTDKWPEMQEIIATVINYIKTYFPGVPILPTIGNNDVKYWD